MANATLRLAAVGDLHCTPGAVYNVAASLLRRVYSEAPAFRVVTLPFATKSSLTIHGPARDSR